MLCEACQHQVRSVLQGASGVLAARVVGVGERGVAVTDLAPSGTVRIGDREWSATMKEGEQVSIGGDVRVVAVYSGGVLKVSGSSANPGSRS